VAAVPVLEIAHLCAGYSNHDVLENIHLSVQPGEWCALVGPNGCGKTTLLLCVGSQLRPRLGTIRIDGYGLAVDRLSALGELGYACAPKHLPALLTGYQCLEVYAGAKELSCVDHEVLDLAAELGLAKHLNAPVETYSLGARQKLSVVLALLGKPKLIVLDEVFSGLDPASALVLKSYLRARVDHGDCGVLLATHDLSFVERYADTAALLLDGRIIHEWNRASLDQIRSGTADSLEEQLAVTQRTRERRLHRHSGSQ
jgi:ABC-2 type transport system ATP-binding protein